MNGRMIAVLLLTLQDRSVYKQSADDCNRNPDGEEWEDGRRRRTGRCEVSESRQGQSGNGRKRCAPFGIQYLPPDVGPSPADKADDGRGCDHGFGHYTSVAEIIGATTPADGPSL